MGSMDKNGSGREWWKGSFPTWIVAIMIGLIGFFLQRELSINDDCRKVQAAAILELKVKVESLQVRIGNLEKTVEENHILLNEISRKMGATRRP
jgi:hypothetical protein